MLLESFKFFLTSERQEAKKDKKDKKEDVMIIRRVKLPPGWQPVASHIIGRCGDKIKEIKAKSSFWCIVSLLTLFTQLFEKQCLCYESEAVFLVMLGTSLFPARHELFGCFLIYLVASWERARTQHD
jgi:hypothetical protein